MLAPTTEVSPCCKFDPFKLYTCTILKNNGNSFPMAYGLAQKGCLVCLPWLYFFAWPIEMVRGTFFLMAPCRQKMTKPQPVLKEIGNVAGSDAELQRILMGQFTV